MGLMMKTEVEQGAGLQATRTVSASVPLSGRTKTHMEGTLLVNPRVINSAPLEMNG